MTPQRRTALVSVGAACALIALKLSTGIASGSLGLVSEALHSGTDLVAALLTFFAVGVASKYYRGQAGRKCMSYMLRSDGSLLTHSDSNVGISYASPLSRKSTITAHLNLNKWEMAFYVDGVPLGTAFRFTPTSDPEPLFPVACFGNNGGSIELQKPSAASLPENVSPSRTASWPELDNKGLPMAIASPSGFTVGGATPGNQMRI